MPSPRFEPRLYGTTVSVANHSTGWANYLFSYNFRGIQKSLTSIWIVSTTFEVHWLRVRVSNISAHRNFSREGSRVENPPFLYHAPFDFVDFREQKNNSSQLVDPTVTRSTIRAEVGVAIVPQTISRHLAEANLKSKRPFRALPLTPEHRQLCLQWCQARSMWNVTDWQKVMFSDESRFVLGTDDNRVRLWRCPAYDSRSILIVMHGTLMGQRYVDDILRPHVGPFLNGLPGAIFQQDNARPHTARVAQDFLRHFQTLPWPARSPDFSLVEPVWDQLKRRMPSCHSVHDLELAVQDLGTHLPQDNIRCLINSMPDRVAACIAAGGGPTRY
ncbi:transposable element Tcb2 transposase [Trichonephila clavipes]|nr:transposable element Tcb2 transposase [Trichonephila clavipes]